MILKRYAVAALGCLAFSSTLYAGVFKISASEVSFIATGKPGIMRVNGTGAALESGSSLSRTEKNLSGELKVAMDKFSTGIDLRDEHMKENYFEVTKFPIATLKIANFELDENGEAKQKPFKGILNFRGIDKEVEGVADVAKDQTKYSFKSSFKMLLSDFKIDVPTYAGVKVADKVEVTAKLEANEQP